MILQKATWFIRIDINIINSVTDSNKKIDMIVLLSSKGNFIYY